MTESVDDQSEAPYPTDVSRISFRKWAWAPLYAKIWWCLAAIYWIMFIPSCYLTALIWLRDWLYPSLLMIVCHPFFMLPIMGFGTFERWWHSHERGDWEPSDTDHLRMSDYGPSGLHWDIDPLDPRSPFFGSPSNSIH